MSGVATSNIVGPTTAGSPAPPPPVFPPAPPPPNPDPPPAPAGGAPGLVSSPVATGTGQQGDTLSVTDGTWTNSPTSFAYQWQRDGSGDGVYSAIGGATNDTYVLQAADVGCNVRCRVRASNL